MGSEDGGGGKDVPGGPEGVPGIIPVTRVSDVVKWGRLYQCEGSNQGNLARFYTIFLTHDLSSSFSFR